MLMLIFASSSSFPAARFAVYLLLHYCLAHEADFHLGVAASSVVFLSLRGCNGLICLNLPLKTNSYVIGASRSRSRSYSLWILVTVEALEGNGSFPLLLCSLLLIHLFIGLPWALSSVVCRMHCFKSHIKGCSSKRATIMDSIIATYCTLQLGFSLHYCELF